MDSNGENLNKKQFARAVRDLERITRQIAARYIAQGVPLDLAFVARDRRGSRGRSRLCRTA